jgi:hypothetical protein
MTSSPPTSSIAAKAKDWRERQRRRVANDADDRQREGGVRGDDRAPAHRRLGPVVEGEIDPASTMLLTAPPASGKAAVRSVERALATLTSAPDAYKRTAAQRLFRPADVRKARSEPIRSSRMPSHNHHIQSKGRLAQTSAMTVAISSGPTTC